MNASAPHYLLFSESTTNWSTGEGVRTGNSLGRWRIVLEAADGSSSMEASDEEDLPADRLELLAVIRGLEAIPQPARVTLVTGSHYVNRGLRFGLNEWRQNGWNWERYGKLSRVANADLWQRLDHALRIHQVQCRAWRFDAGHVDVSAGSKHALRPHGSRWKGFRERCGRVLAGIAGLFGRPRQRATTWCVS